MKSVPFACILAMAFAPLLLIAQKPETQPELPLELILSPERISVPSDGDFTLQLHVVNHSNESYDLSRIITSTGLNLLFDYEIRTSEGKIVARLPNLGALMVMGGGGIGPPSSGAVPVTMEITGLMRSYEMKKPGIYTVRVLYRDPARRGNYIGISNTVTVTVGH